jgi:glycosyltransferase involved in cell wall biosynthesis
VSLLGRWLHGAEIAIVHEFHRPPYGGGNQFLLALRGELARRGFDAGAGIGRRTRACLFNSYNFEERQLDPLDRMQGRRVHRVDGPIGTYRGTDDAIDRKISAINRRHADATVFQSRYSLEAHQRLGLEFQAPRIIVNAVDPQYFHPRGRVPWDRGRRLRLVSTSWSDNANKGFAAYQWLDEHLDFGRYEYTFVGRSPVRFRNVRALAPVPSAELGRILRGHDLYVTASLHEPCSNALLEALACGLPALHVRSGSHHELVGEAGLGFADVAEVPGLLRQMEEEYEARQARIATASLAQVAESYLEVMGLRSPAARP